MDDRYPGIQSGYLTAAIRSVLDQESDLGSYELFVVDDHSSAVDVRQVIDSAFGNGIEVYRNETNLGIGGGWNRCIELAKGELIHILHQDDLVRPGFYKAMENAFQESPEAGAAFCRTEYINPDGSSRTFSKPARQDSGLLENFSETVNFTEIQCPAMVVKSSTYVLTGGYREDLSYSLDFEMWTRIALQTDVLFISEPLAKFRVHPNSKSSELQQRGEVLKEVFLGIDAISSLYPPGSQELTKSRLIERIFESLSGKWSIEGKILDFGQFKSDVRMLSRYINTWLLVRLVVKNMFGRIIRRLTQSNT